MSQPQLGLVKQVFLYPLRDCLSASLYPFKVLLNSSTSPTKELLTTRKQGIAYFLAHPFLYPLLRGRLLPAFLLSVFVLVNLFFWTYLPQVAFLALFQRKGSAWVNGTFLVLGEGAAIVAILFEAFFVVSPVFRLCSSSYTKLNSVRMNHRSMCLMPSWSIRVLKTWLWVTGPLRQREMIQSNVWAALPVHPFTVHSLFGRSSNSWFCCP